MKDQLENIMKSYPYKKLTLYEDRLVYSVPSKYLLESMKEMEELIKGKGFNFKVEKTSDSAFIVS
jgi:hypothetical protein